MSALRCISKQYNSVIAFPMFVKTVNKVIFIKNTDVIFSLMLMLYYKIVGILSGATAF